MSGQSGDTEQVQSTIRRFLNEEVREWFKDLDFDTINTSSARGALLRACKHDDSDSFLLTLGRAMLFDSLIRQRFAGFFGNTTGAGDVGTTTMRTGVLRKTKPQVVLYFIEDLADVSPEYAPVDGRISFRLMDHTSDSITPTDVNNYRQRIESRFSNNGGFVWKKGKLMCSYSDWSKGYQLQLLCKTETEGKRVVEQVLDIQNHTPDWSFFNAEENNQPAEAYPTVPERVRIYGLTRRLPRRRPIADVRFQFSRLHINGVPNPIILADRTRLFS